MKKLTSGIVKVFLPVILILANANSWCHSISPSLLKKEGLGIVKYKFYGMNMTYNSDLYVPEVFYQTLKSPCIDTVKCTTLAPVEFTSNPASLYIGAMTNKPFIIKFEANAYGTYQICTRQVPLNNRIVDSAIPVATRVCARLDVKEEKIIQIKGETNESN